jgi:hypothetical protein
VYRPDRGAGPVDTLAAMLSEFNWWLLLLGLVVGGGLTWLVLAETRRREQDLEDDELPEEAAWLEARLTEEGRQLPVDTIERIVQLHRAYLATVLPPDEPEEAWPADEHALEPGKPAEAPNALDPPGPPARDGTDDSATEASWRPPVA